MKTFYIVVKKGYEKPVKRMFAHHMKLKYAVKEAERLSKKHPKDSFRVFKAVGQAKNGGEWHPK